MSFLVSTMLAFALAATVLGAALLVGIFPSGGVAVASNTPHQSIAPSSPGSTASAGPTAAPTPTPTDTPLPSSGGTYMVKPGDSLSLIGQKLHVDWQLIAQANNILPPDYVVQVGQVLIIPAQVVVTPGADFYVVLLDDTISGIAAMYGVDPTDLADYNNVWPDWNSIRVGDILYIPGPGWTPRPTPSN